MSKGTILATMGALRPVAVSRRRCLDIRNRSGRAVLLAFLATGAVGCDEPPAGPTPGRPAFDGEIAMDLVRKQVGFGPRVPGTDGHQRQLEWMVSRLDSLDSRVVVDTFFHVTQSGDSLTLTNVLGRFAPDEGRRILLLAHWDTRPTSDQAADSAERAVPVPGANDGASGTAVLLALAELLARDAPPVGVDLLFVDGEDYGPGVEDMLLGARRYGEIFESDAEDVYGGPRPVYGVLLDMVGDVDPRFPVEGISAQFANAVVRKVWRAAERLGYDDTFPTGVGQNLTDDHVPLIEAGLPTANVIDFTYGPGNAYWHTPRDVPENVSAETLRMVGEVVTELVYSGG
ncbi:MAG: M28 family peptidase [Gemmatimonadetes bacterium]|nr:M28 family peptidase [Gemmatimonadota bacterium]